ncbi:hypothetical protein ACFFU2_10640 [Halomonas alkalicola]|uniref:Core-binding (CB) domain-containing protein n=1 Tax=Halomonas alkalicola TaxID=1930622 RepID=A0ABY9H531_9GAMM|nr:hypothetical protein [Halomonas alkalicola]WLI73420.1 hypothetical protein B6N23_00225 [Halomonas alkalicola]
MGKRKVFLKTDLSTPEITHERDGAGCVKLLDSIPPRDTKVHYSPNPYGARVFDFAPWYGAGIDDLTYACQRQIERFIDKQDSDIESSTILGYCQTGLRRFLDFSVMYAATLQRSLRLSDVDRTMIDGYMSFLRDKGYAACSQRVSYYYTKAVLSALARRSLIVVVSDGDEVTFPKNPYPNSHRAAKGEKPLSASERRLVAVALRRAIQPLFSADAKSPDSYMLSVALFVVALHTGRNATPLVEMPIDCFRAHPKDSTEFLAFYKRRGHTSSRVALRAESDIDRVVESMPTVRPGVGRLIRRVIELTRDVRAQAPAELADRVWLYYSTCNQHSCVQPLTLTMLSDKIADFVSNHALKDSDGRPLRLTIGRLRKTFVNRIYELLDGDILTTAVAAGNQVRITDQHYLRPGEDAVKNWLFMGQCLVQELITNTLGATERTPVGRCSDNQHGQFAPARDGEVCQSFLNCLRCRNYVVTGDDLWRLFSFYWRVLKERSRVDRRRWERHLSHIPRLIDRDVIYQGLSKKVFTQAQVDAARERARNNPHPFWASDTIFVSLGDLA